MKPVGVDEEDDVEEEVAEEGQEDDWLPAIRVREWACEQREDDGGGTL